MDHKWKNNEAFRMSAETTKLFKEFQNEYSCLANFEKDIKSESSTVITAEFQDFYKILESIWLQKKVCHSNIKKTT